MKKSEQYRRAQMAILRAPDLIDAQKLEILATLMADESLAKWSEEKEAEHNVSE